MISVKLPTPLSIFLKSVYKMISVQYDTAELGAYDNMNRHLNISNIVQAEL